MPHIDSEFYGTSSYNIGNVIESGETWELGYGYYGLPRRIWIPAGTVIPPITSTSEPGEHIGTINLPENPTDDDYEAAWTDLKFTWTFTARWGTANITTNPSQLIIPIYLDANDVMLGGQINLRIRPGSWQSNRYLSVTNLVTLTEDLILYEP